MPNLDLATVPTSVVITPGEEWSIAGAIQVEGTATAFDYTDYVVRADITCGSKVAVNTGSAVVVSQPLGTFLLTLNATLTALYPTNTWGTLVIHLHNTATPSLNKHVASIGFRTSAESIV
jgi:hypothetical protein